MKLLYLSCHSVLEYDELKLFKELGIDVFSHGVYSNPTTPADIKRPPLPGKFDHQLVYLSYRFGKDNIPETFIKHFDAIMVQHIPSWVINNWERMKKKIVIWRSIGQSTLDTENVLSQARREGLKVVRYSPRERTIPGFIGEDAMIRFYKDPKEFGPYTGKIKRVFNITQSFKQRTDFCNYDAYDQATKGFPRAVAGSENQPLDDEWLGCVDYKTLRNALRASRVYFYTGTYPASYTLNFIEAWMTGIPIVALGPKLGSSPYELGQDTYEIPDLIDQGVNGYYSDDISELREKVKFLLNDLPACKMMGGAGRNKAITLFGKETIKKQWKDFFKSL